MNLHILTRREVKFIIDAEMRKQETRLNRILERLRKEINKQKLQGEYEIK